MSIFGGIVLAQNLIITAIHKNDNYIFFLMLSGCFSLGEEIITLAPSFVSADFSTPLGLMILGGIDLYQLCACIVLGHCSLSS